MDTDMGELKNLEKTCPTALLSITLPQLIGWSSVKCYTLHSNSHKLKDKIFYNAKISVI
jgi:hypothetical protein